MPSYRFCRPDDIPLLVHAVETCSRVHDPEEPPWTADTFRRGMREIDLWPSNSMLALDTGGEPVAVMIGTKRPDAVAVHRLGVRPGHQRQGHGLHLLTSLSQKLAVLGPDRLVAEVPDDRPAALACFAAAGWRREATLVDWERPPGEGTAGGAGEVLPAGLVEELTVEDLDAAGVLADAPATAWCRTRRTLLQSADRLSAAAVVGPERVEGWVVCQVSENVRGAARWLAEPGAGRRTPTDLSRRGRAAGMESTSTAARLETGEAAPSCADPGAGRGAALAPVAGRASAGASPPEAPHSVVDLLALGAAEPDQAALVLGVLLRGLAARHPLSPLVVPRLAAGEMPPDLLAAHGFAPGRSFSLLAATAKPL